jgi:hypothetical protein
MATEATRGNKETDQWGELELIMRQLAWVTPFLFGLFYWGLEQELDPKPYSHMLSLIVIANGLLRVSFLRASLCAILKTNTTQDWAWKFKSDAVVWKDFSYSSGLE